MSNPYDPNHTPPASSDAARHEEDDLIITTHAHANSPTVATSPNIAVYPDAASVARRNDTDESDVIEGLIADPRHDSMHDRTEHAMDHERASHSSVLTRIPDALGALGQNISHAFERAISAKDDYVVAVKVSHEAQEKLEKLVQAGVFRSRADAAAYLIDEGINAQAPLFERVDQKIAEIDRLRAELRGMVEHQNEIS